MSDALFRLVPSRGASGWPWGGPDGGQVEGKPDAPRVRSPGGQVFGLTRVVHGHASKGVVEWQGPRCFPCTAAGSPSYAQNMSVIGLFDEPWAGFLRRVCRHKGLWRSRL